MSVLRSNGFLSKIKPLSNKRPSIISVLDVGTSKVCCLIAKLQPCEEGQVLSGRSHQVEVLGIGVRRSRGIKAGVVVDINEAETSIRHAVDAAERMAGVTVETLVVNVSSGRLVSEAFSADVELDGHPVCDEDISHVLKAGGEHALGKDRSVIHALPIGYSLDGTHGIQDPRGMVGERLGVNMHVLTAENAPLVNLELCMNRAHLSVEAMVATPYAAGLAALVGDETEMGCALIDIGAGTTTLSIFMDGHFVHADAIAIGGNHVTMDLARGLSTGLDSAETLKIKYGSAFAGNSDKEMVTVPALNPEDDDISSQVPRSELAKIICPRVEETLELVRDRLASSGFAGIVGKRLVLTGGASQLNGLGEVARRIFSTHVRTGRPMGIHGLPVQAKGPAYSTAVGLAIYPQVAASERLLETSSFGLASLWERAGIGSVKTGTGNRFARLGNWLKESF